MKGQRAKTDKLKQSLYLQDMERKALFGQLGRSKARHKLGMKAAKFDLGQKKAALKDRKSQLPWQIGIGAGTSLLSALEGRRRANLIAEREAGKNARWEDMMMRFAKPTAEQSAIMSTLS